MQQEYQGVSAQPEKGQHVIEMSACFHWGCV